VITGKQFGFFELESRIGINGKQFGI